MSKALQQTLLGRRIRPLPFVIAATVLAAFLVFTMILVWLGTSSPRDLWSPRVLGRSYRAIPLGQAISQLEQDRIIPSGTRWARPELTTIPVTARIGFLSTDFDLLNDIAVATRVHIQVPVGQHGEIRGSVTIRNSDATHRVGVFGFHYRMSSPP